MTSFNHHYFQLDSRESTYPVGFACEMQCPAFELGEVLEEDPHERCNVVRCLAGRRLQGKPQFSVSRVARKET